MQPVHFSASFLVGLTWQKLKSCFLLIPCLSTTVQLPFVLVLILGTWRGRERMRNSLSHTKDIYLVYICQSYSEHVYGIERFINFIFISSNSLLEKKIIIKAHHLHAQITIVWLGCYLILNPSRQSNCISVEINPKE